MVLTREIREEIENAVNQAVSKSLKSETFIKTVANNVTTAIVKTIENKLTLLDKSVAELEVKMNGLVIEHNKKMDDLEEALREERAEKEKMKEHFDELDQANRLAALRIFNMSEKLNEDTKEEVIKIINGKMGLSVSRNDIQVCHRVGKKIDAKSRGIYLKLNSCELKQNIYTKKKFLKGTGIIIREDLTNSRVELFHQAISKYGLKQVWTDRGRIYVNVNNKVSILKNKNTLEISE